MEESIEVVETVLLAKEDQPETAERLPWTTHRRTAESGPAAEAEPTMEAEQTEEGLPEKILAAFPGKRQDVRTFSPLTLAYIGDAIYDLVIRTVVVERANRPANQLHHSTVQYVSAGAQARIVQALMEEFTEEELAVYRRGHNSKPHTMAKNVSAGEYLMATGFEAVLGYLYLSGRTDRLLELVKKGLTLAGLEL